MPLPRLIEDVLVRPARPGGRTLTAERLWSLPRVGNPVPSPDGAHVAVPVTTWDVAANRGASRIWLVPTRGGIARALTAAERDAKEPAFSPDGRRLAFVARPRPGDGDDAPSQLAILPLEGGEAEVVSDLPLGVFDPQWLPDGSGVLFGAWLLSGHLSVEGTRTEVERRKKEPVTIRATEERLYRYWDTWLVEGRLPHLFLLDLLTKEARDLMPTSTLPFDWMEPSDSYAVAPDGRRIVFTAVANVGKDGRPRRDLYRLDATGGEPVRLTAANPHASFGARFTADGLSVLYGLTVDPDFTADRVRLMRMDLATGASTPVLTRWDGSPAAWRLLDEGHLVFQAEDRGTERLFLLPDGAPDDPCALRPLSATGSAGAPRPASDGRIWCLHAGLAEPPEVACYDPSRGTFERVTRFAQDALEGVALGAVRRLVFEGAQDEPVQAWLVEPPGAGQGTPLPLLHLIHGGPHGTFGDTWHWRWHAQTFAARGYLVVCVNFQGSTSFGQDFAIRLQGAWGDRPTQDVLRATDLLVAQGRADERRMAIAGGSYGGYLTAWIASQTDRFRCAVNHAGVYDLALQYASDVTWGRAASVGGDIWSAPESVDRYNPARHTSRLATPMLVLHGERDFRVPVDHGLLCYGILKAKGVPARLVYFEDENHWILKPRSSLRWYAEVLGWLDRFLVPPA